MSIDTGTLSRVLSDISNDEVMGFFEGKRGREGDVRCQFDDDNRITVISVVVGWRSN